MTNKFTLKLLRINSFLSQQKVAKDLGISQAYWSMLENHKEEPSEVLKQKIMRYFHLVNKEDLF